MVFGCWIDIVGRYHLMMVVDDWSMLGGPWCLMVLVGRTAVVSYSLSVVISWCLIVGWLLLAVDCLALVCCGSWCLVLVG